MEMLMQSCHQYGCGGAVCGDVKISRIMMCADTVGDLGYAEELGNYAEYSGAPNTQVPHLKAPTQAQV